MRPTADNDTCERLSSQRSIKCIDNLLLPSQADLSPSAMPQQKCHTLHVNKSMSVALSPSQPAPWGFKAVGMQDVGVGETEEGS